MIVKVSECVEWEKSAYSSCCELNGDFVWNKWGCVTYESIESSELLERKCIKLTKY